MWVCAGSLIPISVQRKITGMWYAVDKFCSLLPVWSRHIAHRVGATLVLLIPYLTVTNRRRAFSATAAWLGFINNVVVKHATPQSLCSALRPSLPSLLRRAHSLVDSGLWNAVVNFRQRCTLSARTHSYKRVFNTLLSFSGKVTKAFPSTPTRYGMAAKRVACLGVILPAPLPTKVNKLMS